MINFKIENDNIYFRDRLIDTREHFLLMLKQVILDYRDNSLSSKMQRRNGATLFENTNGKLIVLKDDMLLDFLHTVSYKDSGYEHVADGIENIGRNYDPLVTYELYSSLKSNVEVAGIESKVFCYEFALYNNLSGQVLAELLEHKPYINKLYMLEFYLACKKLNIDYFKLEADILRKDFWSALRKLGVSYLPSSMTKYNNESILSNLKAGYNFSIIKSYIDTPGVKCGTKIETLSKEVRPKSKLYEYFVEGKNYKI